MRYHCWHVVHDVSTLFHKYDLAMDMIDGFTFIERKINLCCCVPNIVMVPIFGLAAAREVGEDELTCVEWMPVLE